MRKVKTSVLYDKVMRVYLAKSASKRDFYGLLGFGRASVQSRRDLALRRTQLPEVAIFNPVLRC